MRILLVEDQDFISAHLMFNLRRDSYSVDLARNGEEGSFMARTNEYDCILLDYLLPKKNGDEIISEIRNDQINTPIIMLTVKSAIDNRVKLLDTGADDFLPKPFSYQELSSRIRAILRRPPIVTQDIFTLGNVKLDNNRNKVWVKNEEVILTRKEYSLLLHLLKNQDNVVSRGSILEHVWDVNADPFSNTIETHILNLRKKIEKPNGKKIVHTICGRGYKLSSEK